MKVYNSGIKYYKYVYGDWEQPVLTSNISNSSFRVSASTQYNTTYEAWRSFDGTADDNVWISVYGSVTATNPQYFYITTDTPLKISKIEMKNRTGNYVHSIKTGVLQASVDNSTWIDVAQISNSNNTSGGTWTIAVNEITGYKYHRFKITSMNFGSDGNDWATIGTPTIVAQKATTILETTEDDYDFKKAICSTYAKHVNVPKLNCDIIGSTTVSNDFIASGFSTSNYLKVPSVFNPSTTPWEFVTKFKLSKIAYQYIFSSVQAGTNAASLGLSVGTYSAQTDGKLRLMASSTNSYTGDIVNTNNGRGTTVLSTNTYYWAKIKFTGSAYNVYLSTTGKFQGEETLEISVSSSKAIYQSQPIFGVYSTLPSWILSGEIDLPECYIKLNGEIWWSGTKEVETLKYYVFNYK